jgi:hypothetical protein
MKRIYHPYWLWEDYKAGFYDNCSGAEKNLFISKILEMFNSEKLTREFMLRVVNEWKYSCEHNLTNESMNKIAYIGQSACCLYCGAPNTITMESWNLLSNEVKERSNLIANEVLTIWQDQNKFVQLCLKLD